MATEGAAAQCPVCGEGFAEAPARCFRCESDLELWWPLDESLRALEGEAFPAFVARPSRAAGSRARHWASRNVGWVVPTVLLAGLGGAMWLSLESTRPMAEAPRHDLPPKPPPPSAAPSPPRQASSSRFLRYVVQPGDSLWRIAAALKGDARRWPELVPSGGTVDPARLLPGQELRLVIEDAP